MGWPIKNLKGQRFGRLKVLKMVVPRVKRTQWVCRCKCGQIKIAYAQTLMRGQVNSCGCLRLDGAKRAASARKIHGHSLAKGRSPPYRSWQAMKARCSNKNLKSYQHYGARGIKVCERWLSFENFLSDMGVRPEGTTINRIDYDGDYEPGNCNWADDAEQRASRRPSKFWKKRIPAS